MLRSLITHVRPRHLAIAAAIYLPVAALMFGGRTGSLAAVRRACGGLAPFDVRGWWSTRDAQAMMAACGPAGRTAYIHQQLLDLLYPVALAAVLLLATGLLVRRFGERWWPVLLPAAIMTVLDYIENVGVWTLLLDWPELHPVVIAAAGTATAVKRVLGFIAFTVPLPLAVAALTSAIRRLREGSHRPGGPVLLTAESDRKAAVRLR
ncbi:hypothetical protein AB0J72_06085 [Dactylosporangium sp. NPDC049742]|uniref:hypothetical protein n=1 Tax=Dactylosporangium sp. NPDC049742 TaxID=3154737 RepID=UPI0034198DB0